MKGSVQERPRQESHTHPEDGESGPLSQNEGVTAIRWPVDVFQIFFFFWPKEYFCLFKQLPTLKNQEHSQTFLKVWEHQVMADGLGGAMAALLPATPWWACHHTSRSRF